ncbi:MAG: SGNH/GDSL hydrolase family protein [Candidatus Binatia bacterium]
MNVSRSALALSLVLAASIARAADLPARVLRILPLGDSITHGSSQGGSYRYPLWVKLVDEGIQVDFVGSLNTVAFGRKPDWPDHKGKAFDPDHEGHWGWSTDAILAPNALPKWLRSYTPDLVLLHLGTNDAGRGDSPEEIVARLERIVELLRTKNPRIGIVLAKLIPLGGARGGAIAALNGEIAALGRRLTTKESIVVVVDQSAGFDPRSDTYDGIHPNASGEEKMAARWLEGIRRLTSSPS